MKTISLRFTDRFASPAGTITEHNKIISEQGFVWYGKLGAPVSSDICKIILSNEKPRILLIHSGKAARYWAYIDKICKDIPDLSGIPEYYRDRACEFKTWFRVTKIIEADKNVMSSCVVASSKTPLSYVSRHSMSPYFIIEYSDKGDNL